MLPSSDNLYSGQDDESDAESFSDELSPTDGYFVPSQARSNGLVPDPSMDYGPVEAKTLIPPPIASNGSRAGTASFFRPSYHERLPQGSPSRSHNAAHSRQSDSVSHTQYTSTSASPSHRRDGSFSELYNPPPAYSESPPTSLLSLPPQSPRPSVPNVNRETYSTFREAHLERGFPSNREPESMVDDLTHESSERATLLPQWSGFSPRRRRVKNLLFATLILTAIAATLSIICSNFPEDGQNSWRDWRPRNSTGTRSDSDSDRPYCPTATIRKNETIYEFATGREFSIVQKTHGVNYGDHETGRTVVRTEGEIRLRLAPPNSEHGKTAYITIQTGGTAELPLAMKWSEDSQALEISTPRFSNYPTAQCVYLIVTAYLPDNSDFTNIRFDSSTLNLALSNINVTVTGHSKFTTIAGKVWVANSDEGLFLSKNENDAEDRATSSQPRSKRSLQPAESHFTSRRTVIETISGSITGAYPLLDELLISSHSGNIDVEVIPHTTSKSSPAPADLEVQTYSGRINVRLPVEETLLRGYTPVARDYITRVHSTAGNIFGHYYLGSESNFKTTSGNIEISTLPVLPRETQERTTKVPPNVFETHTVSGTTSVTVLEPVYFKAASLDNETHQSTPYISIGDQDPYTVPPVPVVSQRDSNKMVKVRRDTSAKLRSLRSAHSSNTGQVTATYPGAWQGSVHAKTVSSEINIYGRGFRTIKSRKGWSFHEELRRRGVEKAGEGCMVELSNIAGSLEFSVPS